MLQVQWRTFSGTDLYDSLTLDLANMVSDLEDPEVLHDSIGDLWTELERKLKCSFIVVMDEAQVLGNKNTSMYASPESQELRSIFSPIIKALLQPSKKLLERKVFVSGTGVSFLKLEDDIGSVIAKEGGAGGDPVDFVSAPFSSWTDVPQVREFCRDYLKLEDGHEEDNCQYLLEKFRGRRRCLVSCVERLLRLAGGTWKKSIVDDYFKEITSENNHATSIYYAVRHLCESKGTFVLNGQSVNGAFLVQTIGYSCFYAGSDVYTVLSDRDMTLLERGLGQLTGTSGSKFTFTIFEPTVLESIKNYLKTTVSLQKSIKDLMVYGRGNSSAIGREFEKLFTFHVPKLFDGTKLLADMCCFKDATLPPEFTMDKATITGNDEGVWTESYSNHTVSEFLDAEEKSRPQCLIFEDLSGAHVLFVVRLGNLKIPVFCQLKLRNQVNWAEAEATTDPKLMYKKKEHVDFRKRVLAACKNGCISLVVAYPATKPDTCEPKCNDNRLVGYIGKEEMTILFGNALCGFLSSIKDGRGQHL